MNIKDVGSDAADGAPTAMVGRDRDEKARVRMLLSRAAAHRSQADTASARKKLAEAFALAERLRLARELADCALECARILLAEARPEKMPEVDDCLIAAHRLVERAGYDRRRADLQLLTADLKLREGYRDLAHAALAATIAIVRNGWWGHLPELTRMIDLGDFDDLRPALGALQQRQLEYDRIADTALADPAFRAELSRTLEAITIQLALDDMPRHVQRHYAIELLDAKTPRN